MLASVAQHGATYSQLDCGMLWGCQAGSLLLAAWAGGAEQLVADEPSECSQRFTSSGLPPTDLDLHSYPSPAPPRPFSRCRLVQEMRKLRQAVRPQSAAAAAGAAAKDGGAAAAAAAAAPQQLVLLLRGMGKCVSYVHERKHELLLTQVLDVPLWQVPRGVRAAALELLTHLVVANGALVQSCLQTLVYSLLPPPGPPQPDALAGRAWQPSEEEAAIQDEVLAATEKVGEGWGWVRRRRRYRTRCLPPPTRWGREGWWGPGRARVGGRAGEGLGGRVSVGVGVGGPRWVRLRRLVGGGALGWLVGWVRAGMGALLPESLAGGKVAGPPAADTCTSGACALGLAGTAGPCASSPSPSQTPAHGAGATPPTHPYCRCCAWCPPPPAASCPCSSATCPISCATAARTASTCAGSLRWPRAARGGPSRRASWWECWTTSSRSTWRSGAQLRPRWPGGSVHRLVVLLLLRLRSCGMWCCCSYGCGCCMLGAGCWCMASTALTLASLCAGCRWEDIVDVQTEEAKEEEGGLPKEEEPDIFELEGGCGAASRGALRWAGAVLHPGVECWGCLSLAVVVVVVLLLFDWRPS